MLPKAALSRGYQGSHRRHERDAPTKGRCRPTFFLTGALKNLFAVVRGLPRPQGEHELPAASSRATNTEDKIGYMRQSFNDTVMKYNTAIQTFLQCSSRA